MKEIHLNIPVIDKTEIDLIITREQRIGALNDEISRLEADGGDATELKRQRRDLRQSRGEDDNVKARLFDGKYDIDFGSAEWTEDSVTYRRLIIMTDRGRIGIDKIVSDIQAVYPSVQVEKVVDDTGLDFGVKARQSKVVSVERIEDAGTNKNGKTRRYYYSGETRTPLIDDPIYPPLHEVDPARPTEERERVEIDDDGEEGATVVETVYKKLPRLRGLPPRVEI